MKIVLIGIQGSGKSTQGNLLAKRFKVPYLSTGHIFREIAKQKTQFGRYIKEVINSGALVTNEIAIHTVFEYLKKPDYKNGFILDGFPRTITQVEAFNKENIDHVVYIRIKDKSALERLLLRCATESREDDTQKAIKKRIRMFHKHTKPVLKFYKYKGILIEVNGERSVEKIQEEIVQKIEKK
ncbi:MAG: hypothetical protein A2857_02900 [Candidatus Levybacteria bacterium RIFCSPHIGHO2_01_FULL_36_15]|nr:MAG: hypothetical protein A2857_02900 [Candidatus Levybacteria bacterium RIFCSPHIGHO2_01_FULL_36_15]OGH38372.1 MAG: hypothetical protein A2905_06415 [Candidatus Levybacteria bacterium RIFCSPLOWO2_01_FULL_36_10]